MTDTNPNADVANLPFERALAELESIVRSLEQGNVALEDSITIYERGQVLQAHCDALLRRAEARIEKVVVGQNGEARGVQPLDVDG
jgi:exodeoxyribonuclease VII small subunit